MLDFSNISSLEFRFFKQLPIRSPNRIPLLLCIAALWEIRLHVISVKLLRSENTTHAKIYHSRQKHKTLFIFRFFDVTESLSLVAFHQQEDVDLQESVVIFINENYNFSSPAISSMSFSKQITLSKA